MINVEHFTYNSPTQTFSIEASTLEGLSTDHLHTGRIEIKGKTATVAFQYMRTKKDQENDVLYWQFVGSHNGQSYQLKVFND